MKASGACPDRLAGFSLLRHKANILVGDYKNLQKSDQRRLLNSAPHLYHSRIPVSFLFIRKAS
jgi:hypothetical protein